MKNFALVITITSSIFASGCSTIIQGTDQNVNVRTISDIAPNNTQCTLSNEEGIWHGDGVDSVTIDRDGNPLMVSCENEEQKGMASITPRFQAEWLLADILWDACILTLSCFIDAGTNAFYEYPGEVIVPMSHKLPKKKQDTQNQEI